MMCYIRTQSLKPQLVSHRAVWLLKRLKDYRWANHAVTADQLPSGQLSQVINHFVSQSIVRLQTFDIYNLF